ncbi:MAG: long-chain fatty acid--CoA ligase [Blastocatellia bacterium]
MPSTAEIKTLIDLFDAATAQDKRNLLNVRRDGVWQAIAASELSAQVRATAMGLHAIGVKPGDHVGLLSENRPEWTMADLAVLNCAAADVPIHTTQAPAQISYILNDAEVEVLFISNQAQYDRAQSALREVPKLRVIVAFDQIRANDERLISLAELQKRGRAADSSEPGVYDSLRRSVEPGHLATLIYTSGTTGEPKGVMLTHRNLVSNVMANAANLPMREGDVILSFLPLSHIFERTGLYLYLSCRVAIHYAESVEQVAQNLREVRPHFMTSVPRLFEKIYARTMEQAEAGGKQKSAIAHWAMRIAAEWAELKTSNRPVSLMLSLKHATADKLVFARWRAAMGGRIRYLISGGAPLSVELARIFYGAGLPILQGYGLTESSPAITANMPDSNRLGSVGKPLPGITVKIADDGEILCHGPNVMTGYYHKPEATAEALEMDAQGRIWLHTGDIGYQDEDGYLYITDRKKDLIKTSGGKYIAPQPIENEIKRSRFVNQVVVIGDGRKFPVALIVPQIDALKSYAELKGIAYADASELLRHPQVIDLMKRQVDKFTPELAHYEKVKAVALLGQELTIENGELTPTLKVRRRVVAEKYKPQIDRLYAEQEERYAGKQQTIQ